jgi:alpha-L-fucosidase
MNAKKLLPVPAALLAAQLTLSAQAAAPAAVADLPLAPGPFEPTLESLKQYRCPEWFRDAKFGIWAHWGPQAVPMDGDWYARGMYEQGKRQYAHHLAKYGHPSTNGYKDIIPLWKAEKWDPDRLMALYKKAGARYFVSMGCHHDNFDLWNSRFHRWNAVNLGPKRDVVGDWQKAAWKQGLRFGVSEHMGASFTWFQVSHGSDKTGPLAGVPYDGADPRYEDLYHQRAAPDDKEWYSKDPRWHREWYQRVADLIGNYHLDLLYTDGAVPFGDVGVRMVADLYNTDISNQIRQAGHAATIKGAELLPLKARPRIVEVRPQVIYTCKQKRPEGRWVQDIERGVMAKINPEPWQTDTSIGDWYYNRNWKFRPVSWVIQMLADIVSKNGNLLLNVVQRPDGSLDAEVEQMLAQLAAWNAVNGEAIFGTRPWLAYGEGTFQFKGGRFNEDYTYTANDIRFTTRGATLYAIALGWPADGRLTIKSLAAPADGKGNRIKRVELLGHKGELPFLQNEQGLAITLPTAAPCEFAWALKVTGADLKPVDVK